MTYVYALTQDGMEVARVESNNGERAMREIMHYAMMYGQDGPCEVRAIKGELVGFGFEESDP